MNIFEMFKGFPNLHPLFVHFPIVLLLLAAAAQMAVLFSSENKQLKWLSLLLMMGGSIGAFIAIKSAAHISGDADEKAIAIFETHQFYGQLTFYTSLVAAVIRFVVIKWFTKKWMEYVVLLVFITSAIYVTITAHHGAQMVYIYDVGPQGNGILSN